MNFILNNVIYSIRFHYENAEDPQDENPLEAVTYKRIKTICKITKKIAPQNYETLAVGCSANHSTDLFTKDAGRKLAMAKAMLSARKINDNQNDNRPAEIKIFDNKESRKKMWIEYFKHHKEGRKLLNSGKV